MVTTTEVSQTDAQDPVLTRLEDGALWITLNRPKAANAIRAEHRDQIVALLESASGDPAVRVVVLNSTGRHFCGGMDLTVSAAAMEQHRSAPTERVVGSTMLAMFTGAQHMIRAILDCLKPVVAVVQGPAAGLGLYMALSCDLIVASEQGAFVETFMSRAMALHCGGAHLLPARMGLQRAKEFVFLGERLSARDAQAVGLVNRVVPAEELDTAALEIVRRLATGPTAAIGLSKMLLNRSIGADRSSSFNEEAMVMEINGRTHDMVEGTRAFVERRPPEFTGR